MRQYRVKLALLATLALALTVALAGGQQAQPQNSLTQDQAQQQAEKPPHVDVEPDPESRKLEKTITDAYAQEPHMAYSDVSVHATDKDITLTGTVLTATAKNQAAQIATEHAAGRKINNKIRVNPNIHPGPGL